VPPVRQPILKLVQPILNERTGHLRFARHCNGVILLHVEERMGQGIETGDMRRLWAGYPDARTATLIALAGSEIWLVPVAAIARPCPISDTAVADLDARRRLESLAKRWTLIRIFDSAMAERMAV
jgi:hypothetical protein